MKSLAGAGLVAVTVLSLILLTQLMYSSRCEAIQGEYHALRGCKVINKYGEVQWIQRP